MPMLLSYINDDAASSLLHPKPSQLPNSSSTLSVTACNNLTNKAFYHSILSTMRFFSIVVAFAMMSLSLAAPVPVPGGGIAPDANCGPFTCDSWKREE